MFPASTKKGGANVTAGPLDTCKTPSPAGPVPIPYANMVDGLAAGGDKAAKRTQKKIIEDAASKGYDASSATSASIAGFGDEAATKGGIVSGTTMGSVSHKLGTAHVKFQGRNAVRLGSMTAHNGSNTNMPAGTQVAPSQTKVVLMGGDDDD